MNKLTRQGPVGVVDHTHIQMGLLLETRILEPSQRPHEWQRPVAHLVVDQIDDSDEATSREAEGAQKGAMYVDPQEIDFDLVLWTKREEHRVPE